MALAFAATPPSLPLFASNNASASSKIDLISRKNSTTKPIGATKGPIRQEQVLRPASLPPNKPQLNGGLQIDFKGMIDSTLDSAKELFHDVFGFNTECLNGGTRITGNKCKCPYGYRGTRCEEIICENKGIRHLVERQRPPQYVCKCPEPNWITGKHCERVHCENNGNWSAQVQSCVCDDRWYYGKFCEGKRTHLPFLIGVPLVIIIFILLLCYLCKKDWCPRRPSRRRRRDNYRNSDAFSRRRPIPTNRAPRARTHATGILVQEHLLGEERGAPMRSPAYPPGIVPPYVIRLDTIPTFNPGMVGGVDPAGAGMTTLELIKEIEPPPSYDQAMAAPRPPAYTAPSNSAVPLRDREPPNNQDSNDTPPLPTSAPPRAPPQGLASRASPSSSSNTSGSSSSSGSRR